MPRTAILYIAERCNQACVFCLEEDGSWNEFIDPSTQQIFDTLARLRSQGAQHITFMGGETFFRKDLPRILYEARKKGYTRIGVTTNGTVLSKPGFLKDLIQAGLDFIELSIHGHTPELANHIGGTSFTFDRQAEALAQMNEAGIFCIVNVVICPENAAYLGDIVSYVSSKLPKIRPRFKLKFVSMIGLAMEQAKLGRMVRHEDIDFAALGHRLKDQGALFWFYNLPLCQLGEHAIHSHELSVLACDERYMDFEHRGAAEYYESGFQLEGRVWPNSSCSPCSLRPLCPGLEESYRGLCGEGSLRTQTSDPIPWLEAALRDRGLEPALAPERLQALRAEPRPSRFIRPRPEGALRLLHPELEQPLDIVVELKQEGRRSFAQSRRFALSYRAWSDGDAYVQPLVASLLNAAVGAMRDADKQGASLPAVYQAILKACPQGFRTEALPLNLEAPKKRIPLPLLSDLL